MTNEIQARGPKTVIARWEGKNGKKFVELYTQIRAGESGCGYDSHLGSRWFGAISVSKALALVEHDRRLVGQHTVQVEMGQAA